MVVLVLLNLLSFAVFLMQYIPFSDDIRIDHSIYYSMGFIGIFFFIISLLFYVLSAFMNPGHVLQSLDLLELLELRNDKNFDPDYLCLYCKVIQSKKASHCMICGHCVENLDHHCVYINNCIGRRNHKYFILFLLCTTIYLIISVATSIKSFITHRRAERELYNTLDWVFLIYTISVNFL